MNLPPNVLALLKKTTPFDKKDVKQIQDHLARPFFAKLLVPELLVLAKQSTQHVQKILDMLCHTMDTCINTNIHPIRNLILQAQKDLAIVFDQATTRVVQENILYMLMRAAEGNEQSGEAEQYQVLLTFLYDCKNVSLDMVAFVLRMVNKLKAQASVKVHVYKGFSMRVQQYVKYCMDKGDIAPLAEFLDRNSGIILGCFEFKVELLLNSDAIRFDHACGIFTNIVEKSYQK